jgi:hypothetical protein
MRGRQAGGSHQALLERFGVGWGEKKGKEKGWSLRKIFALRQKDSPFAHHHQHLLDM